MADPFMAEIRIMSFNFPPKGWAFCDGQLLSINQNTALFSLLGTTFGGDGRVNFGLPDLRGRTPIHVGSGHTLGELGGEQSHTLSISEIPVHNHVLRASSSSGDQSNPNGNILARTANNFYGPPANLTSLNPQTVAGMGGNQAHQNMQPYLVLSFCIALQGIFPSAT
jgi:microcystin-dependent protein